MPLNLRPTCLKMRLAVLLSLTYLFPFVLQVLTTLGITSEPLDTKELADSHQLASEAAERSISILATVDQTVAKTAIVKELTVGED